MAPTEREEGLVESEVLLGKEGWLLLAQQYTRQFEFEFVDRHLPWLVYYQQEPALLKQDLQHFGLYLEILFVSIWFLGRASRIEDILIEQAVEGGSNNIISSNNNNNRISSSTRVNGKVEDSI